MTFMLWTQRKKRNTGLAIISRINGYNIYLNKMHIKLADLSISNVVLGGKSA